MRLNIFNNLPIKKKLVLLILGITSVTLLLFALASVVTQIRLMKKVMVETKGILVESITDLSTAAISFSDYAAATDILRTLRADLDIESAVIFTDQGKPFARYHRQALTDGRTLPATILDDKRQFSFVDGKYKLEIFCPIFLDDNRIGTLYVLSNTDRMLEHIRKTVLLLLVSVVVLLGVTFLASARLQELITRPVSRLARTARDITEKGDYGLRVENDSQDEIGQLIDDFNGMLTTIQERDVELQQHRQNLEALVRERTNELRAKRDEALAAARAKSEFLANMSHEIRTPMNGVIGVLSLLRDAPMTEEFQRLLDTATRSADSLLLIINDILDFSKIDAGKITFESIVFDLREVMEETSELFIDTVNLKNIDLTCFIPTNLACKVKGDPTRLRQIITNLLSNAVKFTEHGEVKLQVSVVNREEQHQELLFTVEDTGIGIAEDAISKLFDKFTQADGSMTRKYGGTGLGLSVCKQLVEKQGGTIGLNSRLGFGSMFWFTLPLLIEEESFPLIPYRNLKGKTYLVIDDNETSCMIIEKYLKFCDAEVFFCSDGERGELKLEELHQQRVSINGVLIDYTLPDMNGLQFATRVRKRFGSNAPEMILMGTGTVSRIQLDQVGVRSLLLKPIRQQELYGVLADLPVHGRQKMGRQPEKKMEDVLTLHGSVLLVDDEPINQKIGHAILTKFGLETELASNGSEAVRLSSEKEYSAILMDVQMPEMSGYEATELIRAREEAAGRKRVTIIAMTANAMESTRKRCFDVGMDDFFTKPIKPDVLAERLAPWLTGGKGDGETHEVEAAVPEVEVQEQDLADIWNLETALGFVGGDKELFVELIHLFLDRNTTLLSAIETALHSGSAVALRDAAHSYKGAVNHFAAWQARDLAYALEVMGKDGDIEGGEDVYKELQINALSLVRELEKYLQLHG